MSFDGSIVKKITKELYESLNTGRINKIYQLSKYDLLFVINTKTGKKQLIVSNSPSYSRIHLTTMIYEKPDTPPMFCMFLRKHLESGIIKDIYQITNDRVIVFVVQSRNEIGDLTSKKLIVEVMGRHSNIIVTDEEGKILEAIKHVMPFDNKERTVFAGAMYQIPISDKIDPFDAPKRNDFLKDPENINDKILLDNFLGFSPLVAKEIIYRFEHSRKSIQTIFDEILNESDPQIITARKDYFYYTNITYLDGERKHFNTVNELLDRYYYEKDTIDIIKQKSKDLVKFIKNNIIKAKHKIEKLNKDLVKTEKRDALRVKGELVQANISKIIKGDTSLTCIDYYTNKEVTIDLNPKLPPSKNSAKYFKKYKKLKASIPYINIQIKEALIEIRYFEQLLQQVENSSLKDIEEIKEELIIKNYIKKKLVIKKKKKKPNYDTYFDEEGIQILVGKNNIQNEYITHKMAKHNEIWFHAKEAPGSHVVVKKTFPLSETTIRTAAMLAAYFSKMKKSSSVPIDYVEVRYLKKVPGRINSFVTYRNNKTIYIDPDEDFIINLRRK
ncbi:MAG: NFACT family protein [Candidatus Izimaplasma sp.]|nr:NFACT family protein [Candidatus Izimaplasma bacterium]